jgi:hypothetical protein
VLAARNTIEAADTSVDTIYENSLQANRSLVAFHVH